MPYQSLSSVCDPFSSAYSAPNDWVMKPSKEGGGNNIWEEEMCSKLRELEGKDERGSFVLMQRLKPPSYKNRLVYVLENCISENATYSQRPA